MSDAMAEADRSRTRTVVHDGREFTVAVDQRYSGVATGGLARIPVLFWTITTDGYPAYTDGRVTGMEDDDFFPRLVATEWPNMQARAEGR
jgi:hypothetical protein